MRQPQLFFRAQTQSWYVQIGKKQHNLGKDKKAAQTQYHELMLGRQVSTPNTTVHELAAQFLAWNRQQGKAPSTVHWYKRHIDSFIDHAGERLKVRDVTPDHVDRWLTESYESSGDNHKNGAVRAISRLFNWAKKKRYIPRRP
jgi:hypothetical protein